MTIDKIGSLMRVFDFRESTVTAGDVVLHFYCRFRGCDVDKLKTTSAISATEDNLLRSRTLTQQCGLYL